MDISAYQHMNIRMSTRGKRPLRNLTPSDKVRAIQRIHNGETKASVSRDIGVPESTLRGWCKNEQKLRFMCRQLGTADQITAMSGIENPPEKRPRFDNLIQTPKYSVNPSFDEFGYSRLPLNGLSFTSNCSNDILEKIALNEIMKKHIIPVNNSSKPSIDNISNQMTGIVGGPIPLGGDYSTPLSMMQNLNLLSLLGQDLTTMSNFNASSNGSIDAIKNKIPLRVVDDSSKFVKDNSDNGTSSNIKTTNNSNNNINNNNNNNNVNNTAALFVKNWARDPGEKASLYVTAHNNSHIIATATLNDRNSNSNSNNTNISNNSNDNNNNNNKSNGIANNLSVNDTNNNNIKDKCSTFHVEAPTHIVNFPSPISLGLSQIPNSNNVIDCENSNTAFLEWCKVFNASLNFLALVAAAAAIHPSDTINVTNVTKKDDNILYKELTKTAQNFDSATNSLSIINSDISSDSYLDSEPEDLSVRSTATSKLSSPANSRPQSPIKSNGSCSPIHSDGEH